MGQLSQPQQRQDSRYITHYTYPPGKQGDEQGRNGHFTETALQL